MKTCIDCKKLVDLNKTKEYSFLNNKEEIRVFFDYVRQGRVKPLIMWGCELCKKRLGVSDFSMYNISTDDQDFIFCSCHGFLHDNQTFRRKRIRMKCKRELL